jgi:hypothetical protein
MAKAVLTFALYQGDALVRRETLSHDIIKVGKDPNSQLQVDDPMASRMHAVIEVNGPDDVTLTDLGNEPVTHVNGAPVNKCKLGVGDQVLIGSTKIMLERAEAVGAEAPPAMPAPPGVSSNPFAAAQAGSVPPAPPAAVPAQAPGTNPFAAAPAVATNPFGAPPAQPATNPFAQPSAPTNPFAQPAAATNPFAIPAAAHASAVPSDAPPGTYTFEMLKSGPDVPADEVEQMGAPAVEVMISWGGNVLHVSHLSPPRNFIVGEPSGPKDKTDFFIPSEKLPQSQMAIVLGDVGSVAAVLPQGATGTAEIAGQGRMSLDQARAQAQPSGALPGAQQLGLATGSKVKVELNGFEFAISAVNAGKPIASGMSGMDYTPFAYFGLTLGAFGAFFLSLAFFVPPMGLTDEGGLDKDRLLLIQQYLDAAAEREQEEKTEEVVSEEADNKEGGTGSRAKGEEGSMGKESSKATNKRYAVKGPKDNPDPHLARAAALREARDFGMIGLLNAGASGDPNAPTAPWGRDTSLGMDDVSAQGNMWGDEIGDAFGSGGLGLSGIGEGGGGRGEGIGLGNIGTLGHGAGTGTGQGFGSGHGRLGGSHKTRAPKVRMGATSVNGRLPAEVIRRIVRQNYGRFRMCYEQGLARNPNLEGRVGVRFVIGRDGAVSNVGNGGSDIPDSGVVSCVISAFYGLSFPQPEGGIVRVTYPIMFSPG